MKVLKNYVKPNIDTEDIYYIGWPDLNGTVVEFGGNYWLIT